MNTEFRLFPEQASSIAGRVDALYAFLVLVAGFFTLLIAALILTFAIRYRRQARVARSGANVLPLWLEIAWSVIPLGLTMIMFVWGAWLYVDLHQPPPHADEIQVVAKQWMWKLQHAGGKREINELHLPLGRAVRMTMISEDVIHSFYVPDFRVKQDVLPGRYTTLWFEPTRIGTYHLFCAEYCGTSHSQMRGRVIVMEPADFATWLSGAGGGQPVEAGRKLFEQYRCAACHQPTPSDFPLERGRESRCPPLEGVFGSQVKLKDGRVVKADEGYIRESILEPQAKVVDGYQPLMPTFKGQLGEEQIIQIITYIKSLSPEHE